MAKLAITQETAQITIIIAGEPTRAEKYENRGTKENPDWQPTGELKFDQDGTPIWTVPATILVTGAAAPLATKLTITAEKQPDIPPVGTMARADRLELTVFNPQVSARSLRPLAPAAPENGGK